MKYKTWPKFMSNDLQLKRYIQKYALPRVLVIIVKVQFSLLIE